IKEGVEAEKKTAEKITQAVEILGDIKGQGAGPSNKPAIQYPGITAIKPGEEDTGFKDEIKFNVETGMWTNY
ncbi:MAG: hypothetical protein ABSB32_21460, partial [Thermodesulfobacteriota bacterium]